MITLQGLGIHFGKNVLFDNVSLQFNPGNRYGIVGANGCGKSTLLKVIGGSVTPESGSVVIPNELRLGFLEQNQFEYENNRIIDVVLMGKKPLWKAITEKEEILSSGAEIDSKLGERLAELEIIISDHDGYQAETTAGTILTGLGIASEQHENLLSSLSGGYKLRVLMAKVLFSEPDVLLLDEPSNHLDIMSIGWLEEYLNAFKGTLLVVSHDHVFLNNVATHIVDIDYNTIKVYTGNYQSFSRAKATDQEGKGKEIEKLEKRRDELQKFITRFQAKATKARQASSKAKQIEKIDIPDIIHSSRIAPRFKFEIARPSGKTALKINNVSKSFGEKVVLKDVSFDLHRGERLAIIGQNGIGKSTLLKILLNIYEDYSGSVELGHEVAIGYFAQDHHELIPSKTTPYEWLYGFGPGETIGTIRGLLGRVLLSGDEVHKSGGALSGGEAARLIFSRIMLEKPNLMILDEPTNHLDLESIEALETALAEYPGTIIFVSHNRYFVQKIATSILEMRSDGFNLFRGDYNEYLRKCGPDYLDRQTQQAASPSSNKEKQVTVEKEEYRSWQKELQRVEKKLSTIEGQISNLESELEKVDVHLANPELYKDRDSPLVKQYNWDKKKIALSLQKKMQQWEKLHEEKDQMVNKYQEVVS